MKVFVSKSFIVAVQLTEIPADVRLVDGDLVPVGSSWCIHIVTTSGALNYFFDAEAPAAEVYRQLSEPGATCAFECVEAKH